MTKQEAIREGIKSEIKKAVHLHTEIFGGITVQFADCDVEEAAENVYIYLHSQGVEIKVERELPVMPPATDEELKARYDGKCQFIKHGEYFNTWYCSLTGETSKTMKFCKKWNGEDCSPEEGIAKFKAGYEAVEPLIEEGK